VAGTVTHGERPLDLDETTRALWALAIISVPIMGVIAFVILQPGQREG